jgi:hypothetical protein
MTIKKGLPYKIEPHQAKKYAAHYNITPQKCLIVPVKIFDNEASCDIRWEDDNGEVFLLQNKFFVCENLVPLNSMLEVELHMLWRHYYDSGLNESEQFQPHLQQTDPILSNQ